MLTTDKRTRRLLFIGFGGLLSLLGLFGISALSIVRKIELQNDWIRQDYVNRDRLLQQMRSDIYLSGTYVRDLLLEPDPARADLHRHELETVRARIERNVSAYQRLLRGEERVSFQKFTQELEAYFASFHSALQWNAQERRAYGYEFMTSSLLPRRMTIVYLADQVALVNQQQMAEGNAQVANLFSRFRRILVAFLVLTLLSGGLLTAGSIRRILRLEEISAARLHEAEKARQAFRELSARLIEVQEAERRSLSRELHDEVGQSVSALLLGIGNVAARVPLAAEARSQLADLRLLAEKTVAVVRDMSLLLRPSMLDDLGLIPALQWQAREVSRNHNVFVQVQADSLPEDIPDEHKTCVYRIVQEALRNSVRHAKARTIRVNLRQSANGLVLTIQDDGQGFRPEQEMGLGILGMEERVTHLHGVFRVESRPGAGARIHIELPLIEHTSEVAV